MSSVYVISFTDPNSNPSIGASFTVGPSVVDGPGNTNIHTNLNILGYGKTNFGQNLNQNFVRLLENFASPELGSSPGNPDPAFFDPTHAIKGQLWFNSTTSSMRVYNGSSWIALVSAGTDVDPFVLLDGTSVMGGSLNLNSHKIINLTDPTVGTDAATKQYVDTQLTILSGSIAAVSSADKLPLAGGIMTGYITLNADPTTALHATTKQYTDTKVAKTGDAMSGFLSLNANPTSNLHAATKQYVDSSISTTLTTYYDSTTSDGRYVNTSGDTMTGLLTLSANPTSSLHAATKQYVDTAVAAISITGALGQGQTLQNVKASRVCGTSLATSTTYTNSTGKTIMLFITGQQYGSTSNWNLALYMNGVIVSETGGYVYENFGTITFIIPTGSTYNVTHPNGNSGITSWYELR